MENGGSQFTKFVLYSYWRSSCSWRVRTVLNLKNIKYETKYVNLLKKENDSQEFNSINPIQKIPSLEFYFNDKKVILSESSSIIEFLEEAFNNNINLLSENIILRAKIRTIASAIACNIQPLQNLPVLDKVDSLKGDKTEFAAFFNEKGLKQIEQLVQETKGKYCVGDDISLADVYLVPQLYSARRFKVNMDLFPQLIKIEKNLNEIEAFKQAHADNQPDTPQEFKQK